MQLLAHRLVLSFSTYQPQPSMSPSTFKEHSLGHIKKVALMFIHMTTKQASSVQLSIQAVEVLEVTIERLGLLRTTKVVVLVKMCMIVSCGKFKSTMAITL